jgi:hypothetical protein
MHSTTIGSKKLGKIFFCFMLLVAVHHLLLRQIHPLLLHQLSGREDLRHLSTHHPLRIILNLMQLWTYKISSFGLYMAAPYILILMWQRCNKCGRNNYPFFVTAYLLLYVLFCFVLFFILPSFLFPSHC